MADTESLGEAGVAWLEALARTDGQRGVRVPTIIDPRGTDFARANELGQTAAMLDLERPHDRGLRRPRRDDEPTPASLSDHPGADPQRARGVRRHRRRDLFQFDLRRALELRGRPIGALGRADRAHAALRLSSCREPTRDAARARRGDAAIAQRLGVRSAP